MRHLKLFENFEDYDDEPYVQTDQETFDVAGLRAEHSGIKFKADLRQKILDAMPREWQDKSSSKFELVLQKSNGSQLFIYHNDDEWFYCEYYNIYGKITLSRYTYYKCDGFDGLMMLLKDLEIIN